MTICGTQNLVAMYQAALSCAIRPRHASMLTVHCSQVSVAFAPASISNLLPRSYRIRPSILEMVASYSMLTYCIDCQYT